MTFIVLFVNIEAFFVQVVVELKLIDENVNTELRLVWVVGECQYIFFVP